MKNVKKIIILIAIVCISVIGIFLLKNIRNSSSLFEGISFSGEGFENYENYNVKLYSGKDCYYAFIPDEISDNFYINFSGDMQLQLGEDILIESGERITDINEGENYRAIFKGKKGNVLESGNIEFYFGKGIPSVYIKSKSGSFETINEDKNKQEECRLSLGGNEHYKCKVKARGNTSFLYNPKPYSISLKEECSLLGMSPCAEWVLLGTYSDYTQQLRNKIALDLADKIGMKYTPESRFVNVYIDNQYNGVYLLTQKVSADGGVVKIDSETGDSYLLEFDARYEQEPLWFSTDTENIVIKSPKMVSHKELEKISSYMREVEEMVFPEERINSETSKNYNDYIDMDSWVKMFLMQDFFTQWDVEFSSFYLYKESTEPLIYAGPIWDFDYTCGYMWRGYYPKTFAQTTWIGGGWLGALNKKTQFSESVKEKYINTLIPCVEKYLEEDYEKIIEEIMPSMNMSKKRFKKKGWKIEECDALYTWVDARKCFMKDYLQNEDLYKEVVFQFGWGGITYYAKEGEKLGYLPLEEYGEIDYYTEGQYGYGVTTGWKDEAGKIISADIIITEDMKLYPIYEEERE